MHHCLLPLHHYLLLPLHHYTLLPLLPLLLPGLLTCMEHPIKTTFTTTLQSPLSSLLPPDSTPSPRTSLIFQCTVYIYIYIDNLLISGEFLVNFFIFINRNRKIPNKNSNNCDNISNQLRTDKGYRGGVLYSGRCIHNYGKCNGILYIQRKIIFFTTMANVMVYYIYIKRKIIFFSNPFNPVSALRQIFRVF